jgi:ubiquinone/menaquinone biosynthesis C-methylase UbiE
MTDCVSHHGVPQAKVIEANVTFYLQVAEKYDNYETYLFEPTLQQSLEDDLDKIGSYLAGLGRSLSCLECGGGTGNLTLKMCKRGWAVTVVDVSEKMLALLQQKAQASGYSPKLILSPIEQFLDATHEDYDLVAFSSVLHHLYSYESVVERSVRRLRPGGIFYSNYDPLSRKHPFCARVFESFDTTIAKILFDPKDVLPGIRRRLRRFISRNDPEFGRVVNTAGDLAEFHVGSGVNDRQILRILQTSGFSVVEHKRFATGRTNFTRSLNNRLRLLESFKIIARRDNSEG